ncbi:MAG: HAD-IA family hydrolase, partial [Lachnospiraceae bacterium]|nr:HAD-IA family hydrolase [Lachnospiraceae bacterium]
MASARDRVLNMDNYLLYPDAVQVLTELSRTHRFGVISDTWPSIETQLRVLGIRQYFSFFTYSFELGVFKPDRRMYLDALEKCGHEAGETVFIDDGPKNCAGAAELGITPILIVANPASDVETPFLKIHSLSELL